MTAEVDGDRRLLVAAGPVRTVVPISGTPVHLTEPCKSVGFVIGMSGVLVVSDLPDGRENLYRVGAAGEELWRTGVSEGAGVIDQLIAVRGEIRAIESTTQGLFQARLDLETGDLERLGEWR